MFMGKDLLVTSTKVTIRKTQSAANSRIAQVMISTYHITLLCLLFTWRCKSGHPKQATSQSSSGQLYRSSSTVSPKISSLPYSIPRLWSVRAKSFLSNSSYRRTGSSVKITKFDSVWYTSQHVKQNPSEKQHSSPRNSRKMIIPCNEHKPCSCTVPATEAHKCDTSYGYRERPKYVRRQKRK